MEKNHSQYKQQKLQKKNKIVPCLIGDPKTGDWTIKSKLIEVQEESFKETSGEITIYMDKKQLNSIAKIVAYIYNDEKTHYMKSTSDMRKQHIYNDLKIIDEWLTLQYNRLKESNEEKSKIK